MKKSVDGLVIWERKTGEADRVISILTPTGVVTAYAKGAQRPKSRFANSTSLLSYSNFELFSGKNMYSVDDASVISRFIKLKTDITALSLATYFCELMKELAPEDEGSAEFLILMLNTLYVLNESDKDLNLIKAAFEFRVMAMAGYQPDLLGCSCCGVEDSPALYFNILEGNWICENCAPGRHVVPNCSLTFLKAMRHIILGDPKRMYSFTMPPKTAREFSDFASAYLISHVDKKFNTLDFYNSLNS